MNTYSYSEAYKIIADTYSEAYKIIADVVRGTNSEFILLGVLVLIGLVIFKLPFYKMAQSSQDKREKQFIDVIKENSAIIAGLKVTLEINGETSKSTWERIRFLIDNNNVIQKNMAVDIAQIKASLKLVEERRTEEVEPNDRI